MLHAVIMALALQATLTPDDVPAMVEAIVEATLRGAETVYVAEESAAAFRALLPPDATISLADPGARYAVRPAGEVLDCRPAGECTVVDGGVLLTIEGVVTGDEPGNEQPALEQGQLLVGVRIRPPRRPPTSHAPVDAPLLVLAERDGVWEVVDTLILVT